MLNLKGGIGQIDTTISHHTDIDGLVLLVDGTSYTFKNEVLHQCLIITYAYLVVQHQVTI